MKTGASTTATVPTRAGGQPAQSDPDRRSLGHLATLLVPLAAIWLLIEYFSIESVAFANLTLLAFVGFAVHYFLPFRHRIAFFLILSLTGIVIVLGLYQGAWLIALSLCLIGLCHLPLSMRARVMWLLLAGSSLALLRVGWVWTPVPASVWPILGSMFMFRLVVYMYDVKHDRTLATFWSSLSYFFLLPNVCFPLFPVVDYKAFRKTYYSEERHVIYQGGLRWIFRGVIQLLLYRLVYQTMVLDPVDVRDVADLAQYLVWPFLLYLRISGQFHVIVGLLKLFGFNLPETHHAYFLASSFTDFWRRINIYWKDFMMKVFYYPAFFALRKKGPKMALLLATTLVFVLTWLLHAYQWFWLRGAFMFSWNDGIFWAALGALVMVNALREWTHAQPRTLTNRAKSWRSTVVLTGQTVGMFCVISVLWSFWSTESVSTWLSLWSAAGQWPERLSWPALACLSVPAAVAVTVVAKSRGWTRSQPLRYEAWGGLAVAGAICLVLASSVRVSGYLGMAGTTLVSLRQSGLNQADAVALERGYYENLLAVDRFNGELAALYMNRPLDWGGSLVEEGLAESRSEGLPYELLPGAAGRFKGATLRTNRWGLHDVEYLKVPPPGCHRIAILGASHAMGSGVEREQTFEARLETRLNAEDPEGCFEVLNFAVYGYNPLLQLEVLRSKVLDFQPRTVIYVGHPEDSLRVGRFLAELVTTGGTLPYPELGLIVTEANVNDTMPRRVVRQRLEQAGSRILDDLYGRMVSTMGSRNVCAGFALMPMVPDMTYAVDVGHEKDVAARAGFVVLDLFGAYDVPDRSALRIAEWDAHPNSEGHRLVADKLYARVLEHEAALFRCTPRP